MGVYKRGNIWWISYQNRGQRIQKAIGRTKRLAELALADLQRKVELGEALGEDPIRKKTFESFSEEYLTYSKANKAKGSFDRDTITIRRHLVPYFEKRQISKIHPESIEVYKQQRLEHVCSTTINKELGTLKHMFRKAIEWNYLRTNPATDIGKLPEREPVIRFLATEEITRLLVACRRSRTKGLYSFVATALNAGLRKSELFHLEWEDIDFTSRILHIRNKENWHTKTYENRVVPMNDFLLETLQTHQRHPDSPYVFHNPDGTRYHDIRGSFNSALKSAGLPHITFHMLRHTFASHLVMKRIDLPSVQRLLGHHDIKTTMRYAHLAPEHLIESVNQVQLK